MAEVTLPPYRVEDVTPGHILLNIGGKRVKVYGEALIRTTGQPDYVIYRNSISEWLSPDREPVSKSDKELIERILMDWASASNICIDIE